MAEVLETAARLSQVIGARPGGTEEEQQASFFIEETMQKAGLATSIEEFNCNPNYELPRFICCVISVLLGLLAMFLPLMVLPAMLITLVTAALYVLEVGGMAPLSNMMKRGISQNVIAKYVPGASVGPDGALIEDHLTIDGGSKRARGARKRKIILVARYDSGRVCRELQSPVFELLPIIHWIELGGMALIPVALLLRLFLDSIPTMAIILNVLLALGVLASIIPIIIYILHQTAPYSTGANNNASSVAVMAEVAKQVVASKDAVVAAAMEAVNAGVGSVEGDEGATGEASAAEGKAAAAVVMHGEGALREAGVLPEGVEVVYEGGAEGVAAGSGEGARAGEAAGAEGAPIAAALSAADGAAAIAQGTAAAAIAQAAKVGAAVADGVTTSLTPSATGIVSAFAPQAQQSANSANVGNVPDWFKRGKAKAAERRESNPQLGNSRIARSRFSDALEAATQASAHSIEEFEAREAARNNIAAQAQSMQDQRVDASAANDSAGAPVRHVGIDAVFGEDPASEAARVQAADGEQAPGNPQRFGNGNAERSAAAIETDQTIEEAIAAAEQQAAAQQVAEEAAVADRTISYIPVAADISADAAEIERAEVSVSDNVEKTASDILEEATAKTIEAESAKKGGRARVAARKRRELSLPSLTGAIGKVVSSQQDAPLADDADRKDGEGRTALKRKSQLSDKLPSTDKASAKSAIAVASGKEGATSSFAQVSAKDAEAALNSLDFSKSDEAAELKARADAKAAAAGADAATAQKASAAAAPATAAAKAQANRTIDAIPVPVESATSQFAAIGETLIEDMAEEDIIIEDVDDSDYTSNLTHTGAMAGPGYVEMPKSRASRIKGFFSRKKKEDDRSFAEAVGIDSDFDARKVGSARGGWESFQNQSADYDASRSNSASATAAGVAASTTASSTASATSSAAASTPKRPHSHRAEDDGYSSNSRRLRNRDEETDVWASSEEWDDWNGGAFSNLRKSKAESAASSSGQARSTRRTPEAGSDDASAKASSSRTSARTRGSQGRTAGGDAGAREGRASSYRGASIKAAGPFDAIAGKLSSLKGNTDAPAEKAVPSEDMLAEREMIRRFNDAANSGLLDPALTGLVADPEAEAQGEEAQSAAFPTEVWFVALGAELTDNAGMKSFLAAHEADLSGAIIIELDGLGAGTLSQVGDEGTIRRKKGSSRMKRYVAKAGTALGMHINSVQMNWRESASFFAAEKGLQTAHLVGYKDGKPEYLGEDNDVIENLSEEKMMENAAFVMELMRNI